MSLELILVLIVVVIGFVALYFMIRNSLPAGKSDQDLEDIVNQVFGKSAQKVAEQSRDILQAEKENIKTDLANKQKMLETLVGDLRREMKEKQQDLRLTEQDRSKKFGQLSDQLEQHRLLVTELRTSTQQLARVLSNNQQRGEWGERIIEDLLKSNGLVEGIHYRRQAKLGATAIKPDITLLLPNERVVPVDVKFPYSEIQKMAEAESKKAKEEHLKQFGIDLKNKINKVAEYIKPEENTLDYAIMFVPNEAVFSFINQKLPQLVDEAMSKRVLIVSPFTFLIVARTVMESYRNFMMEDRLRDVIKHIDGFTNEWSRFKDQLLKFGRAIDSVRATYEELSTTRVRQLERKIEQVESAQVSSGKHKLLPE